MGCSEPGREAGFEPLFSDWDALPIPHNLRQTDFKFACLIRGRSDLWEPVRRPEPILLVKDKTRLGCNER